MGREDGNEAGLPGIGDGGGEGGAGSGTRCGDKGGISKVVSVTSSMHKVSSNAVGLLNQANEWPEGSGRGRGRGGHGS